MKLFAVNQSWYCTKPSPQPDFSLDNVNSTPVFGCCEWGVQIWHQHQGSLPGLGEETLLLWWSGAGGDRNVRYARLHTAHRLCIPAPGAPTKLMWKYLHLFPHRKHYLTQEILKINLRRKLSFLPELVGADMLFMKKKKKTNDFCK